MPEPEKYSPQKCDKCHKKFNWVPTITGVYLISEKTLIERKRTLLKPKNYFLCNKCEKDWVRIKPSMSNFNRELYVKRLRDFLMGEPFVFR